jgi:hypothetical protein
MPTDTGSDDDEFPDIGTLASRKKMQNRADASATQPQPEAQSAGEAASGKGKPKAPIRRRKLAPLTNNLLLKPWVPESTTDGHENYSRQEKEKIVRPSRKITATRAGNAKPAAVIAPPVTERKEEADEEETEFVSAQEDLGSSEESVTDEESLQSDSDGSEFEDNESDDNDSDSDGLGFWSDIPPAKPRLRLRRSKELGHSAQVPESRQRSTSGTEGEGLSYRGPSERPSEKRGRGAHPVRARRQDGKLKVEKDLADTLLELQL